MPRLRLAFGRLFSETNAFSPVPTTREDFARLHLVEGADVERVARPWQPELAGLTPLAELSGFWLATASPAVERVPLLSAFALPSGPIEERCWRELADGLLERLAAARPVDGVYLALHGSLRGAGPTKEPEEVLLREVREVVGPDVPVAISLDMHAQLTPAKVAGADLIVGYRTNPHRDLPWVGREAGRLLRLAATKRIRPTSAWRSLPLALGGGKTIDFLAPMRPLLARFRAAERRPGVLRANLFTVHPFSDSPDLGWSVHVTTDGDRDLAEALADELAEAAWGVRDVPPPPFVPPEEALAE
ncbi:MAG TPA: M81 family metallopeptidase, partial [Polyangiaceae bacterium LLY-WYZ-15_(1-7)]|nr:M81 family metallopeptidase [Polyangiaceae bacterium LLY-WYZ-15_(1-7)]